MAFDYIDTTCRGRFNIVPSHVNEIVNLKGYWKVSQGEFQYGEIFWGSGYDYLSEVADSRIVGMDYDEDIGYMSEEGNAGKLEATAKAYIRSSSGSYTYNFNVSPTILD